MDDRAEDADALSGRCGHETPDVNTAVAAAQAIGECRRRVPCGEAWRRHLEPDPQSTIALDLTGFDDARIRYERRTRTR